MANGSISSYAIHGRSVVLRTNQFYFRSSGIISRARRCASAGNPDYRQVVYKGMKIGPAADAYFQGVANHDLPMVRWCAE